MKIENLRLEMGEVTDGDGNPLYDEAVIHFAGTHDSPEINVNAPNALMIAAKIVDLWNGGVPAKRAPTPDLTKALTEFSDFINEPPQYEDKRMVRDYRHELARKWVPLLEQLLALIID